MVDQMKSQSAEEVCPIRSVMGCIRVDPFCRAEKRPKELHGSNLENCVELSFSGLFELSEK